MQILNWIKRIILALTAAAIASPVCAAGINEQVCLLNRGEKKEAQEETAPIEEDFTPKRGKNSPFSKSNKSEKKDSDAEEAQTTLSDGAGTTAQNWYCKHMENGERPPVPAEMSFIDKYDGYFLGDDEKVIYLTFDAGYENGNIEKILDVLKAEEVPGAFFILENLAERNTDLVQRMIEEGHTVCNHTAKHKDMTKISKDEFAAELAAMENLYKEKTGCDLAKYYRPPEGKFNEQNLAWAQELGYKTVFWSFAYADWDNDNQMSAEKATAKLLNGTHNGEVLLLHPTSSTNAEILSGLIKSWKEMGYRFGTLDELTKSGEK